MRHLYEKIPLIRRKKIVFMWNIFAHSCDDFCQIKFSKSYGTTLIVHPFQQNKNFFKRDKRLISKYLKKYIRLN